MVTVLTRKFGLGAENVIARIAIVYSLQKGTRFLPTDTKDSGGKEYSKSVLFGNMYPMYAALMCKYYQIRMSDKDLPHYFKLHLDDGLEKSCRMLRTILILWVMIICLIKFILDWKQYAKGA